MKSDSGFPSGNLQTVDKVSWSYHYTRGFSFVLGCCSLSRRIKNYYAFYGSNPPINNLT